IGLAAHVVEPGFEGFEIGVGVAIIFKTQLLEIPQAAIDGQRPAPVIGIALERDAPARIDIGDDVGSDATGLANVVSSKVATSIACFGSTGISPRMSGNSRSLPPPRSKRTVRTSRLSALTTLE